MSIHKARGVYRVRWREGGKLRSRNFERKVDAERFEAERKLAKRDPVQYGYEEAAKMQFGEYSEMWLRDYAEVHKTTGSLIRDRQMMRDYFFPRWRHRLLNSITKRDIIELQAGLSREGRLSGKTINNVVGLAHKMFEEAVRWDLIRVNPVHGIRAIRVPEQDFRFWTFDERDRFLSYSRANVPELYPIVAVAVNTGMRRGEMEGLLRDCVDFERKEIIVKRGYCHKADRLNEYTKGKKPRRVPMNELVLKLLRERSLIPMNAPILPYDYEHIVWRHFYRAQEAAGVTKIRFHDLRHTFASHLAMLGVSMFQIKEMLGHSDIRTTMRYMHLAPGHLQGLTDVLLTRETVSGCSPKVPRDHESGQKQLN